MCEGCSTNGRGGGERLGLMAGDGGVGSTTGVVQSQRTSSTCCLLAEL